MGIESGPSGYIEKPRPVLATIEGRVESSFPEITIDDAVHVPLQDIVWGDTSLRFKQVGRYNMPMRFGLSEDIRLYLAQLEYRAKGRKRRANLSLTTSKDKPVLFTGTTNGFYAHDPLMAGRVDPFYVVGLQPEELRENMSRMVATYHELGHVLLFHTDLDLQLLRAAILLKKSELPKVAKTVEYTVDLAQALPSGIREQQPEISRYALVDLETRSYQTDRSVHLFHERNAWAAGIQLARLKSYPLGFQDPMSYFDYARLCLATYARHYRDNKFVKGWRKP